MYSDYSRAIPKEWQAMTKMFVTLGALNRDALSDSAKEPGIPDIAVPQKIVRVESLPLLGTGKVNYVSQKHLAETAACPLKKP